VLEPTSDEIAVTAFGRTYLLPDSLPAQYLRPFYQKAAHSRNEGDLYSWSFVTMIISMLIAKGQETISHPEEEVAELAARIETERMRIGQRVSEAVDLPSLYELIAKTKWRAFNPAAWQRHDSRVLG
jgi:uncharacterized protein YecA (UPF0149 family)